MTRLSHAEAMDREMREDALMRSVIDVAALLGWEWVHFRPARTAKGWRTPVEGPLGAGWPDLVLVRRQDRRLIFAELKKQLEQPSAVQQRVLAVLESVDWRRILENRADGMAESISRAEPWAIGRMEVHVWRPSDLRDPIEESVIYRVLR